LYSGIEWDYNQTTPAINAVLGFSYYNDTSLTMSVIQAKGFYNTTQIETNFTNYFTTSQVLGFDYYNSTDFNYNDYRLLTNHSFLGADVGIGTSTPNALLSLSSATPNITLIDSTTNQYDLLIKTDANKSYFQEVGDSDGDILTLDLKNARVGIGANNPQNKLDVVGDANVTGIMKIGNSAQMFVDGNGDMIFRI